MFYVVVVIGIVCCVVVVFLCNGGYIVGLWVDVGVNSFVVFVGVFGVVEL